MAGYFCMEKAPFHHVYIHGTVRDIAGKKMSKSLGNIIDPLEIIQQYGTDALRYTLITATAIGQDISLSEERFAAGRNFANKLWNATRFVLSQQGAGGVRQGARENQNPRPVSVPDRWIHSRLQRTIKRVKASLDQFLFNDAANALYEFLWHDVCDWYLEIAKVQGQQSDLLVHILETSLRLLHPVMPFVTEELWQYLNPAAMKSIMVADWPKANVRLIDEEAEKLFEQFQSVVAAIRNTRAELHVPLDSRPPVHLRTKQPAMQKFFESHQSLMRAIAHLGEVSVAASGQRPKDAAATVVDGIEVLVPLAGLIEPARERDRLQQRIDELTNELSRLEARLRDKRFTQKAPKEVVEQAKSRRVQVQDTLKKFADHLAVIQAM